MIASLPLSLFPTSSFARKSHSEAANQPHVVGIHRLAPRPASSTYRDLTVHAHAASWLRLPFIEFVLIPPIRFIDCASRAAIITHIHVLVFLAPRTVVVFVYFMVSYSHGLGSSWA
jgi:hypothetical protein